MLLLFIILCFNYKTFVIAADVFDIGGKLVLLFSQAVYDSVKLFPDA